MSVKLSALNIGVHVAFNKRALDAALNRHGTYELCLMWGEFFALALATEKLDEVEKHKKLREGFRFFAQRQGLNPLDY